MIQVRIQILLKNGIATGTAATGKFKEVTGVMQKDINVHNVGELFVKCKTKTLNPTTTFKEHISGIAMEEDAIQQPCNHGTLPNIGMPQNTLLLTPTITEAPYTEK